MKCEKSKDIWLEDELIQEQKEELFLHMQNCPLCKEEFDLKNAFIGTVSDYKERFENMNMDSKRIIKSRKTYKKRKLIAPLVAASIALVILASTTFAKDQMFSFVNFATENFGWNLALTQSGTEFTKGDIKVTISSIAVSKTNISFAFVTSNLKDEKSLLSPQDVWLECDGEVIRPNGAVGTSFEKKSGYGELNFSFPNGLKENLVFKIRNLAIYKDVGKGIYKKSNRKVEVVLEVPIKLDKAIIEKAHQNCSTYLINKSYSNSDLNIRFDKMELESSKLVINHTIKDGSIFQFGDIKITSKDGNTLSERRYTSGNMEYSNKPGKYSKIMMNENWPFESVLLPVNEGTPDRIEIGSYLVRELVGEVNLSELVNSQKVEMDSMNKGKKDSQIIKEDEKEFKISNIILKLKTYKDSSRIDILCNTKEQISLLVQESGQEVSPIEALCDTNSDSKNGYLYKYVLKNGDANYSLELFNTKEKEADIEINLLQIN